jgi:hypothetical protein
VYFAAYSGKNPPATADDSQDLCGMFWYQYFSDPAVDNLATGISPHELDGAGKPIKLYTGTYQGLYEGHITKFLIDVVGNRVYATQISDTVGRLCMIAAPYSQSPKGLILTIGDPAAYGSRLSYDLFAASDLPVLALDGSGGLSVKAIDFGHEEPIEHLKRVSSRPDFAAMFEDQDSLERKSWRLSCIPKSNGAP